MPYRNAIHSRRSFVGTMLSVACVGANPQCGKAYAQEMPDPENTLYLDLKGGRAVIVMYPELAPLMVARVKQLTREGFYDGTPFHRVIDGFMAQGGDPTGTGTGGSKLPDLPAEFTNRRHFLRGTCGAARAADPNSANSQFFIMFTAASHLDGLYTIWGQVVQGMEFVDLIKKAVSQTGLVWNPDHLIRMRVAADVKS